METFATTPASQVKIPTSKSARFLSLDVFRGMTIAGMIMVNAHTIYPNVAGNPAFSGISISAPHTPQKTVVIRAYANQDLIFIMEDQKLIDRLKKHSLKKLDNENKNQY